MPKKTDKKGGVSKPKATGLKKAKQGEAVFDSDELVLSGSDSDPDETFYGFTSSQMEISQPQNLQVQVASTSNETSCIDCKKCSECGRNKNQDESLAKSMKQLLEGQVAIMDQLKLKCSPESNK